jgi:hypothetical protein
MLSKAEGMQDDPKVLQVLCRCFALSLLYPYESAAGKFQVVVADAVLLMEARIYRQICRAVAQVLCAACQHVAWLTIFSKLRLQSLRFSMCIDCVIILFRCRRQVG